MINYETLVYCSDSRFRNFSKGGKGQILYLSYHRWLLTLQVDDYTPSLGYIEELPLSFSKTFLFPLLGTGTSNSNTPNQEGSSVLIRRVRPWVRNEKHRHLSVRVRRPSQIVGSLSRDRTGCSCHLYTNPIVVSYPWFFTKKKVHWTINYKLLLPSLKRLVEMWLKYYTVN